MEKRIAILGGVNLLGLAVHSALSWGIAPRVPYGVARPREREFFAEIGHRLSPLGEWVRPFLDTDLWSPSRVLLLSLHSAPLVLSTIVFLGLLILLSRSRAPLHPKIPTLLRRWAIGFALVCIPAAPVLVQDFWLSPAWGRMVLAGINPYSVPLSSGELPPGILDGLPVDAWMGEMTYGPLWALFSGLLVALTGARLWITALLFKLLIAGAWVGCLLLLSRITRGRSIREQAITLAIFGWLPLSVTQTVGEGHNDVVMVCLFLVWLMGAGRGIGFGLALAASALVKYVTAPCLLLDLLSYRWVTRRRYRSTFLACLLLIGVVFGIFVRSQGFFEPALAMTRWQFFTPRDFFYAVGFPLEPWTGVSAAFVSQVGRLIFPAIALVLLWRFHRRRDERSLQLAALGLLAAVTFSALGHVWPWFLLWILAPAALVPGSALTRWSVGFALVIIFAIEIMFFFPDLGNFKRFFGLTFFLYLIALNWYIWMPRRWLSPGR